MILLVAKVLAITLAIFVIGKTAHDFKKKQESWVMCLFWSIVWSGVIIITLFPQVVDLVFGRGRSGLNTFMGLVIILLLYLCYRLYIKADRTERAVHHLVKELAIKSSSEGK